MGYYNMVMLAAWCFFCGKFISGPRTLYTFMPSVLIFFAAYVWYF